MNKFVLKMRKWGMMSVRGLALCGTIALVLLLANGPVLEAAPVTFAFEAEVSRVDLLSPADLPFTVENGDVLTGQFTFEPLDAEPGLFGFGPSSTETVQEFDFSLSVESTILSKPSYTLQVIDNNRVIDSSLFSDQILFGVLGKPLAPRVPVPGTDNLFWGLRLLLPADGSVLTGPDISSDSEVWNQFKGHFILNFQEASGTNISTVLSIRGSIRNFLVVPEPSTFCLAIVACCCAFSRKFYSTNRRS